MLCNIFVVAFSLNVSAAIPYTFIISSVNSTATVRVCACERACVSKLIC